MSRTIVDTGPLVALLNLHDTYHVWARDLLDTVEPPLWTCEAVVSEACHLVRRLERGADAVLALLDRGVLAVRFRLDAELPAVRRLMARYASVPMALADACLIRMTELDPESVVVTLDADFKIYRRYGRQVVPTIMPGVRRGTTKSR
jgi:predicted nucleic acid-binding protein